MSAWPYNDPPPDFRLPDLGLTGQRGRDLHDAVWAFVIMGYDDPDHFNAIHYGQWGLPRERLAEALRQAREARVAQQAQWAGQPVRTNLDLAFEDLNAAGIVARQSFTCCGTCGTAEIWDERDDSREWRGYVFYHEQDAENIPDGGTVHLSYGVFEPAEVDVVELVNTEVTPRLTAQGLGVEWNNDRGRRILVTGAQWYVPL